MPRTLKLIMALAIAMLVLSACYPNPAPPGLTPIPSLAPPVGLTPVGTVLSGATVPPPAAASTAPATAAASSTAQATTSAGPTVPPSSTTRAVAPTAPSSAQPTAAAAGAVPAGNAQQGAALFATNCSPCHGQGGQGGGIGPKLVGDSFVQTSPDQAIFATIANGRPGTPMPAWSTAKGGSLSDPQIANLVAYVKSLQK